MLVSNRGHIHIVTATLGQDRRPGGQDRQKRINYGSTSDHRDGGSPVLTVIQE